jgi:hypothetical protein
VEKFYVVFVKTHVDDDLAVVLVTLMGDRTGKQNIGKAPVPSGSRSHLQDSAINTISSEHIYCLLRW